MKNVSISAQFDKIATVLPTLERFVMRKLAGETIAPRSTCDCARCWAAEARAHETITELFGQLGEEERQAVGLHDVEDDLLDLHAEDDYEDLARLVSLPKSELRALLAHVRSQRTKGRKAPSRAARRQTSPVRVPPFPPFPNGGLVANPPAPPRVIPLGAPCA